MEDSDLFSQFGLEGDELFNNINMNLDAIVATQQLELKASQTQIEPEDVDLEQRVQEQNNHINNLLAQIEKLKSDLQVKNGKISVIETTKNNKQKILTEGGRNSSVVNRSFLNQMKENSAQATNRALQNYSTQFPNHIDPDESVELPSTQALINSIQTITPQQSHTSTTLLINRYISNGNALWFDSVIVFFINYLPSSTRECHEPDLDSITYTIPQNLQKITPELINNYLKSRLLELKNLFSTNEEVEYLKQFNDKLFLVMDIREWNSKESKIDQLPGILFKYAGFLNALRNLIDKLIEKNKLTLCTTIWYIFTKITTTFTSFLPHFYNSGPVSIEKIPNLIRKSFESSLISPYETPIEVYLIWETIENILLQTPKVNYKSYEFIVDYLISEDEFNPMDFNLNFNLIYYKTILNLIQDHSIYQTLFNSELFLKNFSLLTSKLINNSLQGFITDNNQFKLIDLIHSILVKISLYNKEDLYNITIISEGDLLLNIINWVNFIYSTTKLNFEDALSSLELVIDNEIEVKEFNTQQLSKTLGILINSIYLIFSTGLEMNLTENFELEVCLKNLEIILETQSIELDCIAKSEIRWLIEYFNLNGMSID
ncbi:hypothetical protein CONCODRAFT_3391 [Conidiobolus coronatus NRRL 28638]|uniref:Uncharacterized protein n=1 Tax=Conidiobolus coronatus (strain ATCC 28846 / CBS 209.66 / NRRL 28638) TaxID=796925 RepID=A0A137PFE1_CONC2|nr:hypothetical protein CONCODRAFT_3391 [Conidiobolus coronatus NRRL 28638]|eukprot:KXN73702.1 hypothetical protein CONCODRAFT_3391 [Conidiobolus coronatus NRRL 28638]